MSTRFLGWVYGLALASCSSEVGIFRCDSWALYSSQACLKRILGFVLGVSRGFRVGGLGFRV